MIRGCCSGSLKIFFDMGCIHVSLSPVPSVPQKSFGEGETASLPFGVNSWIRKPNSNEGANGLPGATEREFGTGRPKRPKGVRMVIVVTPGIPFTMPFPADSGDSPGGRPFGRSNGHFDRKFPYWLFELERSGRQIEKPTLRL